MRIEKEIQNFLDYYEKNMPKRVILEKNGERYDEINESVNKLTKFAWELDENAKIELETDKLTGSILYVTITTNIFVVDQIDKFCDAIKVANNFEVVPKKNGLMEFNVGYHDLYKPVLASST